MTTNKSVNPDVHDTNKITAVAQELVDCQIVGLDWSYLYGTSVPSVTKFRDLVSSTLANIPTALLRLSCPKFVDYMIEDCAMDVFSADWMSLALAVDNIGGMYHPIRLTKIVIGGERDE